MKRLLAGFSAIAVLVSCKSTSSSQVKDLQSPVGKDLIGLRIDALQTPLTTSHLKVVFNNISIYGRDMGGSGDDYLKVSDAIADHMSPRDPFHMGDLKSIAETAPTKLTLDGTILSISDLPIGNSFHSEVKVRNGIVGINVNDLTDRSWQNCPVADETIKKAYTAQMKTVIPDLTLEMSPYSAAAVNVPNANGVYKPTDSTSFKIAARNFKTTVRCVYGGKFKELDAKFLVYADVDVSLNFDQDVFKVATKDKNFAVMKAAQYKTEKNGKGTRYFSMANPQGENLLQRWNLQARDIIIDDSADSDGKPLESLPYGKSLKTGMVLSVKSLRAKFPEFGKKVFLLSERTEKDATPNIAIKVGQDIGATGLGLWLAEDTTGEIIQARVAIGNEAALDHKRKIIQGFKALGLIDDADASFEQLLHFVVFHELAHAYGLRHNFDGLDIDDKGNSTYEAIMAYIPLSVPIDYLTNDLNYQNHDILSLRYLYAELLGDAKSVRKNVLPELMKLRLGADEYENPFADYNSDGMEFWRKSSNPKVVKFREAHSDFEDIIQKTIDPN